MQAISTLPLEIQGKIEAECQDIDQMAIEGGLIALADEALSQGDTIFGQKFSAIQGLHGKVLWAFLEYPDYWNGATLISHADNISSSSWKKRTGFPQSSFEIDVAKIQALETELSDYFHSQQNRGHNCKVELLIRCKDIFYFFAYPEDYSRLEHVWEEQSLSIKARNPAFEIILVYKVSERSLDIYAPNNTPSIPALQAIFAKSILGVDALDWDGSNTTVYQLQALSNRNFVFQYPETSGIKSVSVILLRLNLHTTPRAQITLSIDSKSNAEEIYNLLEERINVLEGFTVTQAKILVQFHARPGARKKTRRFPISSPCWCALRHTGNDKIIRTMLKESGIELSEPKKAIKNDTPRSTARVVEPA